MNAPNLTHTAMLASLTIRRWQGTINDKKITHDVARQADVKERRAGHYRKHAIDVDALSFKAVGSATSELRHKHYWHTLPWGQDGARILTAANFDRYSKDIRDLRAAFDSAVDGFISDYPALRNAAQRELKALYNPSDYPNDMRSRFGIDLHIMPLPAADDFRVTLSQESVAQIRSDIEGELQRTTAEAMREPYQRLYDHISRMVERLRDPEGIFRDTLVSGLAELCTVLPALNLTNDTLLDDLTRRAEGLISGVTVEQLREVPSVRADVAKRAAEIQDLMAGFMGAAP